MCCLVAVFLTANKVVKKGAGGGFNFVSGLLTGWKRKVVKPHNKCGLWQDSGGVKGEEMQS
jgi:hypothetical protein